MTYSYQPPLTYGTQNYPLTYETKPVEVPPENVVPQQYEQNTKPDIKQNIKQEIKSSGPAVLTGAALGVVKGAIVGGIVAAKKNPCIIDGNNINDKFATKVYEKYRKKVPDAGVSMKQLDQLLSKINSAKSADEIRTLFASYPEAAEEACSSLGKTPDEFLDKVTRLNLKRNKRSLTNKLKDAKTLKLDDIKNDILTYWNPVKKRFEKGPSPDKDLYRAIKKSSAEMKSGKIAKFAAIGAAICGAIAYAVNKIINHKKLKAEVQKNQP